MASSTRLGVFSHMYVNTGTYGTPTLSDVDLIGDLAVNADWDEGESSARRSQMKTQEPTMLGFDLDGRLRVDMTDTQYNILRDAFNNKTILDIVVLNGAKDHNNSIGYRVDCKVFGFGEDQALGNVLFNALKIKPCASDNKPKTVKVVAGVPVYTDLAAEGTA